MPDDLFVFVCKNRHASDALRREAERRAAVIRPGTHQLLASTAKSSKATILVILIIGFTAGPDVSL